MNKEIAKIFREMAELLDISGEKVFQRINAYRKAANYLDNLKDDVEQIYQNSQQKNKWEAFLVPRTIGEKNAKKIEEYIKKKRIKEYEDLKKKTAIRQIITHFFKTKGLELQELKENAKKRKIVYSRYTKPAKELLDLAGSIEAAKEAIDKVAVWANSRKLDYTIETVFKRWLELDRLKPKEKIKKPFYKGDPMIYSETKKKWFVISKYGEWLEFADKEDTIEWKIID